MCKWTLDHQEVVLIFSLQVGGVDPLESTKWHVTFTIHDNSKQNTLIFCLKCFSFMVNIYIPRSTQKKIYNTIVPNGFGT